MNIEQTFKDIQELENKNKSEVSDDNIINAILSVFKLNRIEKNFLDSTKEILLHANNNKN